MTSLPTSRSATRQHPWQLFDKLLIVAFVLIGTVVVPAEAQSLRRLTLQWDPNSEPDLGGYVVMVGSSTGAADQRIDVGRATSCALQVPLGSRRYAWVHAYNTAGLLSAPSVAVDLTQPIEWGIDSDGDGLPDNWERTYRVSQAASDDDEDGVRNLTEFQQGTDPTLPNEWLLAEGATGFFRQEIALANPGPVRAAGILIIRAPNREEHVPFTVPAGRRETIDVNAALGALAPAELQTIVQVHEGGVVAERTMQWAARPGAPVIAGHTARAVASPSTTWYFAEGDTRAFDTFFLLANPGTRPATTVVEFVLDSGRVESREYRIAPRSRITLHANALSRVAQETFWTRVRSDVPIAAERAMYVVRGQNSWLGGHASAGITRPSPTWLFSEGASGRFFDTWLLLANPNAAPATVKITWLREGAPPLSEHHSLAAGARVSLLADSVPGLAATAFGVSVSASAPVLAERSMYWPGSGEGWHEGHVSAGSPSAGTRWAFAEGQAGGPLQADTYLLLANPSALAATVTVTLLPQGADASRTSVSLAPQSRTTLRVNDLGLSAERFGIVVDSDRPVIAERSMYWSPEGWFYRGGTNEMGIKVR
jgi:hypothetical protein